MRFGAVRSSDLGNDRRPIAHLYPNPRVKVEFKRRTGSLNYSVSTAPPQEDYTEIARFNAGGDAHTYAMTVRDRIAETTHLTVEYTATQQ